MEFNLNSKPDQTKMYEMTFIVVPNISEAEYKKVAGKFESMVTESGGKIINTEHWGQKKLAYPIRRNTSGYYCYVEFSSTGDLISKLEREFGYDEKILRYLTVKLDRHALEYNNKRRSGSFAKKDKKEAEKTA